MADLSFYLAGLITRWGANQMSAGASRATLATSTAGWMPNQDAKDRLRDAAFWLRGVLAEADGNDDRASLLETILQLPSGALLNDALVPRLGPIASIRVTFHEDGDEDTQYRSAEPDSYTRVEEYAEDFADEDSDIEMERYAWAYNKGRLYHTGTFAAVDYVPKIEIADDDDLDELLQTIPDRYTSLVIAYACENIPILQSQTRVGGAQHMGSVAERGAQLILRNQGAPPVEELLEPHEGG